MNFDKDEDVDKKVEEAALKLSYSQKVTEIKIFLQKKYDEKNWDIFKYYLEIASMYFSHINSDCEKKKEIMAFFPVSITNILSTIKYKNQVEKWKIVDETMKEEWENENSHFKVNVLNLVEKHLNTIKTQLELALNTAREERTLPEFAYYTALKWALTKEKELQLSDYMLLLNMPVMEELSVKELYMALKDISDILILRSNSHVSTSFNALLGVSIGDLLDWGITELRKFQYDID